MKKIILGLTLMLVLVGCGATNNTADDSKAGTGEKKKVTVTTSFLYDMVG